MNKLLSIGFVVLALGWLTSSDARALTLDPKSAGVDAGGVRATWSQFPQGWLYRAIGDLGGYVDLPEAGPYVISVQADRNPVPGDWPRLCLNLNGYILQVVDPQPAGESAKYRFVLDLPAGPQRITVSFIVGEKLVEQDAQSHTQADIGPEAATQASQDQPLSAPISPCISRFEIRMRSDRIEPQLFEKAAWVAACEQREQEMLRNVDQQIDRARKNDKIVRVIDRTGKPLAGATVEVRQVSHEFLFGCNSFMLDRFEKPEENAAYRKRFAELFNYTTTYFYWQGYEHEPGKPMYGVTDRIYQWASENGIKVKGHPLLADFPTCIPAWHQGLPTPQMQEQRITEIVTRFKGRIDAWDVVNEPAHGTGIDIAEPYKWARQANPEATLVINDHSQLANGYPPLQKLLQRAAAERIPYDAIGIQAHNPLEHRFPLEQVQRYLDLYAQFGKEIHITEFLVPSGGQKIEGSHLETAWDEQAQADYAVKFYKTCFAHPAVTALTWWDLSDNGSWLAGSGLVRSDLTPKPAYEQLKTLIHETWKTTAAGATGTDGHFPLRGFRGKYHVTATVGDKTVEGDFVLDGSDQPWDLQIDE